MTNQKVALIMGVANKRSIAWSCVQSFLDDRWNVILTYQNDKMKSRVESLVNHPNVLGGFAFDVTSQQNNVDDYLTQQVGRMLGDEQKLHAVVHSLAHAPNLKTPLLETTLDSFTKAHEISAYSLISIAKATQPFLVQNNTSSITALSYLGAVRAIAGYNVMGPAKASLESIVRGLAMEMASSGNTRVNAVSAGPIPTLAAKGGIAHFERIQGEMKERAPLGNVTAEQVASTVKFLASLDASGITGQTIYVDGGYSTVAGPPVPQKE